MSDKLFADSPDELLIAVYARQGRTLDDLPYTPEFERMYESLGGETEAGPRAAVFRRLHNLRKAARLPRMGRSHSRPPRVAAEHEAILVKLVSDAVGKLGQRDQLPYTPAFDRIIMEFNTRAGLSLSPHDVWRIIAKLAK